MIKPITGTWFEFLHHGVAEGKYWDAACEKFTSQQWKIKIAEIAELGMDCLVLMCVACFGKSYYKTNLHPRRELGCPDPIETLLSTGDELNLKIFISNGYFTTDSMFHKPLSEERDGMSKQSMEEITKRYGDHESFYGWYFPVEAELKPYYDEDFVKYARMFNDFAKKLTPKTKTLIAPYGTRNVLDDDRLAFQLDAMKVDFVAYQDEVGVEKSSENETRKFYEILKKSHDKTGSALWADVEVFKFEGKVYQSALLPADFRRIKTQLEAVSPFVEKTLIYQYQGMMNKPDSKAFAGHPDSTKLYQDYRNWLQDIGK